MEMKFKTDTSSAGGFGQKAKMTIRNKDKFASFMDKKKKRPQAPPSTKYAYKLQDGGKRRGNKHRRPYQQRQEFYKTTTAAPQTTTTTAAPLEEATTHRFPNFTPYDRMPEKGKCLLTTFDKKFQLSQETVCGINI